MRSKISISKGLIYTLYHSDLSKGLVWRIFHLSKKDRIKLLPESKDKVYLVNLKRVIELVLIEFDKEYELAIISELAEEPVKETTLRAYVDNVYKRLAFVQVKNSLPIIVDSIIYAVVNVIRRELKSKLNFQHELKRILEEVNERIN